MDAEVIRKMARLARLDEEDGRDLAPDLLRILAHAERLRGVDVDGVEPFDGAGEEITRPDRAREGLSPSDATDGAPEVAGGRFRVPGEETP